MWIACSLSSGFCGDIRLTLDMSSTPLHYHGKVLSQQWPPRLFSSPGNPSASVTGKTPVVQHTRKTADFPPHIRDKTLEETPPHDNRSLALDHFLRLVASPATPNTPTPMPLPVSGFSGEPPLSCDVV